MKTSLKHVILDNENDRYVEIYIIRNTINGKSYVGQAVSHILNHKRYRPYGSIGRFKCHVSEAYSDKAKQCRYLNNAIRKYGKDKFVVEILESCSVSDSNDREQYYIKYCNTLYPEGYNLTFGGNKSKCTEEVKLRVASGVSSYYKEQRFSRFMQKHCDIPNNFEDCIRPLKRNNVQYGWYVYVDGIKTDFGGVHMPIDESRKRAIAFIIELKERLAKHLDAGNSLESLTTTL